MDSKEIVNVVRQHLMAQGAKSEDADMCKYRGPNGLMCAVGVLIPDDRYNKSLDYGSFTNLIDAALSAGLSEHIGLLGKLQNIHDSCDIGDWEARLAAILD